MPITAKKAVAKKVVKKVVAKKVVPVAKKPAAKKTTTVKALVFADNDHSFWTVDGQIFNSLMALHDALAKMDKTVYMHHVTKDRHDFAQWVESVLCDLECAADLRKAKTPTTAKVAIAKHLKTYHV
jgi:hypothetical protein